VFGTKEKKVLGAVTGTETPPGGKRKRRRSCSEIRNVAAPGTENRRTKGRGNGRIKKE